MATSGSFFKGEKKKKRKEDLERQAENLGRVNVVPRVEIIGKGKKSK